MKKRRYIICVPALSGSAGTRALYALRDDLVEWLFAILSRGVSACPYNVGSSEAMTIRAVAEGVKVALNSATDIRILGKEGVGASSVYVPVVERARRELGLREQVGFADSVRRSAERG